MPDFRRVEEEKLHRFFPDAGAVKVHLGCARDGNLTVLYPSEALAQQYDF